MCGLANAGMDVPKVRAHHLLCMQGFQGYGYDEAFIENMDALIRMFDSDPHLEIEIVAECDAICSRCPHEKCGTCEKAPGHSIKVREMDLKVLKMLGLEKGSRGRVGDILSDVNARFRHRLDAEDICGDCDWEKECLWLKSRKE